MGQYGQTIGIKYFLNKKVKGRPSENPFTKGWVFYPIYVRITVRRQATEIRSLLGKNGAEENFDSIKNMYSVAMEKESELIREHILRQNPFEQDRFSLKKTLSMFHHDNQQIDGLVNQYLLFELKLSLSELAKDAAQKRLKLREPQYYYTGLEEVVGISYDALAPNPGRMALNDINMVNWDEVDVGNLAAWWKDALGTDVHKLYHSYPEEFWSFQQYNELVVARPDYLYTLKDWINGDYQRSFIRAWQDHPDPQSLLQKIAVGVNRLIEKHPDLQRIANKHRSEVVSH